MRIIKQGTAREWWVDKVGTCSYCRSEIQVEMGDKVRETSDRDGLMASFDCPSCNHAVWVYPASASAEARVEKWKGRARQHGCNVEEGDHECG